MIIITKEKHMTYFIRCIKYFFATSVLAIALIVLMVLTGIAVFDFQETGYVLFHTPRFVILFSALALVSAFYPKMTFTARHVAGNLGNEGKPIVINAFRSAGYELTEEKDGVLTFRARSAFRRLRMLFDDGITIAQEGDSLRIEGHRNGVFRVLHHWDAYARYDKE